MKKQGFTLVELLAVITLIGILGLITVPIINDTIKNSRKKAFKDTLNSIVDAAKIYNADTDYLEITDDDSMNVLDSKLKYDNKGQILGGEIYYKSQKYYFNYVYTKYYCAMGFIEDLEIYDISSEQCSMND